MVGSRVETNLHFLGWEVGSRIKTPAESGSGLTVSSSISGWKSGSGHSRTKCGPATFSWFPLLTSSDPYIRFEENEERENSVVFTQLGQKGKVRSGWPTE